MALLLSGAHGTPYIVKTLSLIMVRTAHPTRNHPPVGCAVRTKYHPAYTPLP